MNNIKTVVLKLTFSCFLNCVGCIERKSLFLEQLKNKNKKLMTIEKWKQTIEFLLKTYDCGFSISGGEPMLYQSIEELLCFIKTRKTKRHDIAFHTSLAFPRHYKLPNNLFDSIDTLCISFYANDDKTFKQIRRPRNNIVNFSDVLFNFNRLSNLPNFNKNKLTFDLYPNIYNYKKFKDIIAFIKKYLGSDNIWVNHFEWKHKHPEFWIPEEEQYKVYPYVSKELCKLSHSHIPVKECLCKKGEFILINLLGDVLPCFMFEYIRTDECKPIGNIFEQDLFDIINSIEMEEFKNSDTKDCCQYCFDWMCQNDSSNFSS